MLNSKTFLDIQIYTNKYLNKICCTTSQIITEAKIEQDLVHCTHPKILSSIKENLLNSNSLKPMEKILKCKALFKVAQLFNISSKQDIVYVCVKDEYT